MTKETDRTADKRPGANQEGLKDYNEALIFDILRVRGPIPRRKIADLSGLKFQAVSNIVGRLLEAGRIEEAPDGARGGRPAQAYRLKEDAAFAVGIHLDRATLAVALVNVVGRVLASARAELADSNEPGVVFPLIEELVGGVLDEADLDRVEVLGAGVGVPGPLDRQAGRVLKVPNLAGWEGLALRQELEARLGTMVAVDSDTSAVALGEKWGASRVEAANFVAVYLGVGIGAGVVVGGQAYRGWRGNVGQIGHVQIDPAGPPCYCGKAGCLEVYATPLGVLREARRAALETDHLSTTTSESLPQSIEAVLASPDPRLREVVRHAGEKLGAVVAQAVGVLDPELVILNGPYSGLLGGSYREGILRALPAHNMPGKPLPPVRVSGLGANAGPIGAAALVLEHAFFPGVGRLGSA